MSATIFFHEVGWRTTFQDLGRVGTERLGVPRGGAADQGSARVANIFVGNRESAPLIESLGGAVSFHASTDILVAATGSVGTISLDGVAIEQGQPLAVPAGSVLRIEAGVRGARTYIAFNGELSAERFLGSVAPDQRMGFAQTIAAGAEVDLASSITVIEQPYLGRALFRMPVPELASTAKDDTIRIVDCSHTDEIAGIRDLLAESAYTVTNRSDHVGIRLDGPVLHPDHDQEIVSHGVPIGAIEIPHSDELIVLGRYRTLTAGYPIVGFVTRQSQDLIGQAQPGQELRFAWTDRAEARQASLRFEAELVQLGAATLGAFSYLGLDIDASRFHSAERSH